MDEPRRHPGSREELDGEHPFQQDHRARESGVDVRKTEHERETAGADRDALQDVDDVRHADVVPPAAEQVMPVKEDQADHHQGGQRLPDQRLLVRRDPQIEAQEHGAEIRGGDDQHVYGEDADDPIAREQGKHCRVQWTSIGRVVDSATRRSHERIPVSS